MPVVLPAQLILADEWAVALGNTTGRTEGRDPDGNVVLAVTIQHGPAALLAVEQNGVLGLLAGMELAGELKEQIARLPSSIQEKLLYTVKQALMECPRVAWQMQPPTVTRMGELSSLQLSTFMRIERDSRETFNRFADAIQELSTQLVKVNIVMGQVFAGPSTGVADASHTNLYR